MADLETAASEAVERVRRLVADLDQANEELDRAQGEGERLEAELSSAVDEFDRGAQQLWDRLVDVQDTITTEMAQNEALLKLQSEIDGATVVLQGARDKFVDELASAQEAVTAANALHQQALGRLAAAIVSLRQRADELETRLDETAAEVETFLGEELPQALDAAEARIDEARVQAETAADQTVARIEALGQEFAAAVAEFQVELEAAFLQAPDTIKAAVDEATAAYLEAHRELLAALTQQATFVVETLETTERAAADSDFDDLAEQAEVDSRAGLDGLRRIVELYRSATEHCAQYELDGARQALAQLPA